MSDNRIFDLDDLITKRNLPRVKINSKEVEVQPLNGASLIKLTQLDENDVDGGSKLKAMYSVAEQLLPSLTPAEVLAMTPEQVSMVLSLAQNKIEHVRKLLEQFESQTPQ